jgi:hypothetical protein
MCAMAPRVSQPGTNCSHRELSRRQIGRFPGRRADHQPRAAALPLVRWYPMLPPLRHNNCDTMAPFSQWTKIKTFTNEKECRMHTIGAMQEYGYNTLRESAAQSGANVHFLSARAATRS